MYEMGAALLFLMLLAFSLIHSPICVCACFHMPMLGFLRTLKYVGIQILVL